MKIVMKIAFAGIFLALMGHNANAADSAWLLCESSHLVVNVHEHRAGASDREISLAMIYGMHVLQGNLKNKVRGAVLLAGSPTEPANTFKGRANVDFAENTLSLSGTLSLYGAEENFQTKLSCKEMQP